MPQKSKTEWYNSALSDVEPIYVDCVILPYILWSSFQESLTGQQHRKHALCPFHVRWTVIYYIQTYIFFSLTLYSAFSSVGWEDLVLGYSGAHSPHNYQIFACWVDRFNNFVGLTKLLKIIFMGDPHWQIPSIIVFLIYLQCTDSHHFQFH